jgi:hypothetical protein
MHCVSRCLAVGAGALLLFPVAPAAADVPATGGPDGSATVAISSHPLTPTNAPADEYFGRMKLSNLGVRNIIHAFAVEGNSPLALPLQRSRMEAVDSALVDWGEKYPRDPWLPKALLHFTDELTAKQDVRADTMAVDLLLTATLRYKNTTYAKVALSKLRALRPSSSVDLTADQFEPPSLAEMAGLILK